MYITHFNPIKYQLLPKTYLSKMVSFFGEEKPKFDEEIKEARKKLEGMFGRKDLKVTELKPLTTVFRQTSDPFGYHGVTPIACKIDGDWYHTNVIVDTLGRQPPLGKPKSKWMGFRNDKNEDEPENARGLPRCDFKAKSVKIGTRLADNTDFLAGGRTLINSAELLKLHLD